MHITQRHCWISVRVVHVASQLCYDKRTCTHTAALQFWGAIVRILTCEIRPCRRWRRSSPWNTNRAPGTVTPHCTGWSTSQSRSAGRPHQPNQDCKPPFRTSANSSRQKTWPGEHLHAGSPSDSPKSAAAAGMRGEKEGLTGGL